MTAMTRMKTWWLWAVGAMGVSVVVDLGLAHDTGEAHGGFSWVSLPGGDLLYGFIGCVVIVLASKALGVFWLQRDERYYQDEER